MVLRLTVKRSSFNYKHARYTFNKPVLKIVNSVNHQHFTCFVAIYLFTIGNHKHR